MANGFRLSFFATLLAFVVVVLGAYTRLTDAGLGCPDWPGCYGHLTVPKTLQAPHYPNQVIDAAKAWTEMIHRYAAGSLGIVIFSIVILAIHQRRNHKPHSSPNKTPIQKYPFLLPFILGILVIFQAILGMWTVTLKLFPPIVLAHLIGGLATLSLLWLLTLHYKKLTPLQNQTFFAQCPQKNTLKNLRTGVFAGLFVLILQLMLGGWTSANYAALVCTDFPFCQSHWKPDYKLSHLFNFTTLDNTGRATIHMLHRIGAVFTALVIGCLAFRVYRCSKNFLLQILSSIIAILLITQILLGITNILALLPVSVAVAHNAVAALLLLSLVTLQFYLTLFSKGDLNHDK